MAGINWLVKLIQSATAGSNSNDAMSADRALSFAPVWYAVNKIAGHVAYLPLNLHRATGDRILKPTNHLGYRLLRVRPNNYQTPFVFKRHIMSHALLWGNGRAYIHRDGDSSELIPLCADRCQSILVRGEKVHFYKLERDERLDLWSDIKAAMNDARRTGKDPDVIVLPDSEVLHIPGLGFDGVEGKSLISLARQSWNLGLGAENQERKKQKKGYSGGLMLEAPAGMLRHEKDAEEFLEFFRKHHDGEDNTGKTGLLRDGVKASVLQMSNQDAQFVEQRKFQRQEVALWFLLEQILGDDSSVSYNSLEQKNLAYLQNCLAPWLTIWEEECEQKLLTPSEIARGFYFKFNDGALLRTDKQSTATTVATLISSRVMNPNEARQLLDMNPYEGGDSFENPNTSSPRSGAAAPQPAALKNRFEHLLKVEAKQALDACKSTNFVKRIDALYDKWQATWAKHLSQEDAKKHCENAKRELLDCAGKCATKDDLRTQVKAITDGWLNKVSDLVLLENARC